MDQLKYRNFGPPKPPEAPHLEKNFQLYLDGGHPSYRLAALRKLGPVKGYAIISGSICSLNLTTYSALQNCVRLTQF